jgi:hypothetical protein
MKLRGSKFSVKRPELNRHVVLLLSVIAFLDWSMFAQTPSGRFRDLKPQQQAPIREVVARFSAISGRSEDPEKLYDAARFSVRTTYDAITNALLNTALTAADGRSLGNALTLIDVIEEIAGEVRDAGGDRQFRIYVSLRADAVERLSASQEFRRAADNTIYHKGYPISYRQPGIPSIQISISRDHRHADIDVDYRSSKFPVGLFNGHLSSANSDIRSGDNYARHSDRWQGLLNWWSDFFGIGAALQERLAELQEDLSPGPRPAARGKLEEAVNDFFGAWMVERDVRSASTYFSRESFECLDADARQMGEEAPPGLTLAKTRYDMVQYLGRVSVTGSLSEWIAPVAPWDQRLKPAKRKTVVPYALFEMPESMAESDLACVSPAPASKRKKDRYGKYYASVNRFRTPDRSWSPAVLMVWAKEKGRWKIVRTRVAERADPDFVQLSRSRPAEEISVAELEDANPLAIAAFTDWLESWLVRRDYKRAMTYVSETAKACSGQSSDAEGEAGYRQMAERFLAPRSLSDVVQPVSSWNPEAQPVRHAESQAFTILRISPLFASSLACSADPNAAPVLPPSEDGYYAMAFEFRLRNFQGGALLTLWAREGGEWRICSWQLQAP